MTSHALHCILFFWRWNKYFITQWVHSAAGKSFYLCTNLQWSVNETVRIIKFVLWMILVSSLRRVRELKPRPPAAERLRATGLDSSPTHGRTSSPSLPVSPPALVSFLHFIYQIKLRKGQTNYYLKKHYKTGATPGHNLITRHEGCITFPESSVYAPDQTETFNAD